MDRIPWLKCLFFSFHTLLILMSFHGLVPIAATAPTSCRPDQCSALLQLKEGFIDANLISWQPGTDCCHGWEGVSCDKAIGLVTTLDLSSYNIQGNLSVAIFNLTSLEHLNLAWNNFAQNQILDGFGKLTQLTYLNLSYAYFPGQIPIGIANLTNLISLDLSGLYFSVSNYESKLHNSNLRTLISKLSNLRELYLDGVDISENGTEWCGALSESVPLLQVLSMQFCNLSGPFQPSLSQLHSLTKIDLSWNNFQSSVPDYFSDFPLMYFDFYYSNLTGSFPRKIFQIPTLITLDISENTDLLVTFPDFPLGSSLEIIKLAGTNLFCHILYSIGNLLNLSYFDISRCNMSGQIPSSIGKLVKLHHLDLSFNSLSGLVPPSLFALPNLEKLRLNYNNLSGQFSLKEESSISFSPLTDLDLSYNQLTGPIPRLIYRLSNLDELNLGGNQFSGPIPNSIFGLWCLQILDLSHNNFNGTFKLSLLQHFPNLTFLILSDNQLSIEDISDEESFSLFPRISHFGLASCNLSRIPRLLRYHGSLTSLDLSKNHLHGVIPSWIWEKFIDPTSWISEIISFRFTASTFVNMSYNKFTTIENISICPMLPACWRFSSIDLSFNRIRGHIPLIGAEILDYSNNEFSEIPSNYALYLNRTYYLWLSANKLIGEIPSSIFEAPCLQVLDLSHNYLSGFIPSNIFEAPMLQILILATNNFRAIVHSHIEKQCKLLVLDLSNNNLDGVLPRSMRRCNNLMSINIENNRFVDTFPFWLENVPNLQVLIIKSNWFYGTLDPPNLVSNNLLFQKLRLVDLASNNFHGSLPPSLFRILPCMVNLSLYEMVAEEFVHGIETVYYGYGISIINKGIEMIYQTMLAALMVEIDLSNNNFSGDIPDIIGNLSALIALNLSRNAFTGSIPHSLKSLNHIESLDLSWNNLSGEIPQELTSLNFLTIINLSFNHLVGKIPESPHFSTFNNLSFEGNPGLCGVPLSKQCEAASPLCSTSPSKSFPKKMSATVLLCLFVGLGFGTGFAIVILYPVIKRARKRQSTG